MLLANVLITAPRLRKIMVYDIKIGYIQINLYMLWSHVTSQNHPVTENASSYNSSYMKTTVSQTTQLRLLSSGNVMTQQDWQTYSLINVLPNATFVLAKYFWMTSCKLPKCHTQFCIPKPLMDKRMCELVVSLFKLHKNSTYTYKLGDVHTICRFRWNVRA